MRFDYARNLMNDLASVDINNQNCVVVLCSNKETVIREVDIEVIEWTADGTRGRYRLNRFQLIRQGRGSRAPASSIVSKQDTSFIIIAIPVQLC